jgi:AcrR family transcriptional regulator
MRSSHQSARERILETADDLFYREGIHAVGIDTIIEKSGVAKMSLYRGFASK